jgi:hypothetical protein
MCGASLMLFPTRKGRLTQETVQEACILRRTPRLVRLLAQCFADRLPMRIARAPFDHDRCIARHGRQLGMTRLMDLDGDGDSPPFFPVALELPIVVLAAARLSVAPFLVHRFEEALGSVGLDEAAAVPALPIPVLREVASHDFSNLMTRPSQAEWIAWFAAPGNAYYDPAAAEARKEAALDCLQLGFLPIPAASPNPSRDGEVLTLLVSRRRLDPGDGSS